MKKLTIEEYMKRMAEMYYRCEKQPASEEVITRVCRAYEEAEELFKGMDITIEDDPLGMGALSLSISGFDIVIRGEDEKSRFQRMVREADNFEVYAEKGEIRMNIMFQRRTSEPKNLLNDSYKEGGQKWN